MQGEKHYSGGLSRAEDLEQIDDLIETNVSPERASPLRSNEPGESQDAVVIDLRQGEPTIELVEADIARGGLLGASLLELAVKRFLDIVFASTLLIVTLPIHVCIAIAVKLSSPGPVFYVSDRVGQGGKSFRFLKYRTMRSGADDQKIDLTHLNDVDGPAFKIKDDPRITGLGRFLRRTSLDELPQLLHVLTGEMSLVGPRPPLPEEVAEYSNRHLQRLTVKPGLTCLWQVSGRSNLDFETWIDLDLRYIEEWSLVYDLRLIARTIPAVLSGRGAF